MPSKVLCVYLQSFESVKVFKISCDFSFRFKKQFVVILKKLERSEKHLSEKTNKVHKCWNCVNLWREVRKNLKKILSEWTFVSVLSELLKLSLPSQSLNIETFERKFLTNDCKVSKNWRFYVWKFTAKYLWDGDWSMSRLFRIFKLDIFIHLDVSNQQSSINNHDTNDDANLINNGSVMIDLEGHGEVQFAGGTTNTNHWGSSVKKFMKRYCILYMREYEGGLTEQVMTFRNFLKTSRLTKYLIKVFT